MKITYNPYLTEPPYPQPAAGHVDSRRFHSIRVRYVLPYTNCCIKHYNCSVFFDYTIEGSKTGMKIRHLFLFLMIMFSLLVFCSCRKEAASAGVKRVTSYREIPGISPEEINAIETWNANNRIFIYGALPSTESFAFDDNHFSGYTERFCYLLSSLFGITFVPEIMDWDDIINRLEDGTIDFSGDLIPTPERHRKYFMTDAIAERSINIFTKAENEDITEIAYKRMPKLGFLTGSVHLEPFQAVYKLPFDIIYVDNFETAAEKLLNNDIDAFINESVTESFFLEYDFIVSREFYPLTYIPVSLTARNRELAPIISAVNKYIRHGGMDELANLYAQGMHDYRRYQLFSRLSKEEKDFIQEMAGHGRKILVAMESDNYPVCFYNERDREFQGIVPDTLQEISELTGLVFEPANKAHVWWTELLGILNSGEASMISELLYSDARAGTYLWADAPYSTTSYTFISKMNYPDLEIYQVLTKRVGVQESTVYEEMYNQWFSDSNAAVFSSSMDAFAALEKGTIDLFFSSENSLLSQANYYKNPGFKANIILNHPIESTFGFNKDAGVLCSVINKSQVFAKTDVITNRWKSRTFDYSTIIAQTRVLFLFILVVLLTTFMAVLAYLLVRNSGLRKNLEKIVRVRTHELQRQTAMLSTVYNSIPDLVFCKDMESHYTSCNPSFEKFAGYKESELIGKNDIDIFRIDEKMAKLFIEADKRVLINRNVEVIEEQVTYPDGTKRLLETLKTPLIQNNEVIGMMGVSRDITERKAAEEAAQAASKAKSSFLARMSHEIRTPLNAIIGMSKIARNSASDPDKVLSSIDQVITSSQHLLGIVNDVLDMSKIESGKFEIIHEPFSLNDSAREVWAIISPRCVEKNIQFKADFHDLPNVFVVGDKLRLNQVLINLLGNAVKFTGTGGGIEFRINIIDESTDSITLGFCVADNGIGMTREQVSHLFVPFEQADNTIASRFGGTGLGLSISKSLVAMMGGTISVLSQPARGSTFSFEITFEKGTLPDKKEEPVPPVLNLTDKRILLVEDIEINRTIVKELLAFTGISIDEAENGREAVEMFVKSPPDYYHLIFMDIQMPILDGYEAAREIRDSSHGDAKNIAIIAMTANAYHEDVLQALESGMNGHLSKPLDMDTLLKTLGRYM